MRLKHDGRVLCQPLRTDLLQLVDRHVCCDGHGVVALRDAERRALRHPRINIIVVRLLEDESLSGLRSALIIATHVLADVGVRVRRSDDAQRCVVLLVAHCCNSRRNHEHETKMRNKSKLCKAHC